MQPGVCDILDGIEELSRLSFHAPTETPISYMCTTTYNTHAIQTSPVDKMTNNVVAEKPPVLASSNRRLLIPSTMDRKHGNNTKQAHTPPARDRKKYDGFPNPRGKSSSKGALNSSFNQDFRPSKNEDDFDPFKSEVNPFSGKGGKPRFKVSALPQLVSRDKRLGDADPTKK